MLCLVEIPLAFSLLQPCEEKSVIYLRLDYVHLCKRPTALKPPKHNYLQIFIDITM